MRAVICTLSAALLILSAIGNTGGVESLEAPRAQSTIEAFDGDISSTTISFTGAGEDSSLAVSIPERAVIEDASLDIEGRGVCGSGEVANINFTDTVNNSAWDFFNNKEYPITSAPSAFMNTPFTTQDYQKVEGLDGEHKTTDTSGMDDGWPTHLFEFNLSSHVVANFTVFWAGYYWCWLVSNPNGINLTIWNVTSGSWEIVGGYSSRVHTPADHHIEGSYNMCADDYIDPSTKYMYVMLVGPHGAGESSTDIHTNFISLNLTEGLGPFYPLDPYLDVGGDDDREWSHGGELAGEETLTGAQFVQELQEHVDSGAPVGGAVEVPFVLGSASAGELHVANLAITYHLRNDPPVLLDDVPPVSFAEDAGWYGSGLSLEALFHDGDDEFGNLTFELNGGTGKIWGAITPKLGLNFTASDDHFGTAAFNISCRDRGVDGITSEDDHITYSNDFTVTVTPTDDPPAILFVDGKSVGGPPVMLQGEEDRYLNFTVEAQDIDGDEIVYSLLDQDDALDIEENMVTFLPTQAHVGHVNFTIVATEVNTSGLSDSTDVSVEVSNSNDAPTIDDMDDMEVDEDVWLNFTLTADDPDLPWDADEGLTFGTDFGSTGANEAPWSLDSETGEFSFLPDNSLVGEYLVNFTVTDGYGSGDRTQVLIEVRNVNDPPEAEPITHSIVDGDDATPEAENLTVSFATLPARDPDLIHGDSIRYTWDFDDRDGVSAQALGLEVNWTFPGAGNYTVTLTAADSGAPRLVDVARVTVEILEVAEVVDENTSEDGADTNTSVDGEDIVDEDGGKDEREGRRLGIVLAIVVAVISIIPVAWYIVTRKRRGPGGNGDGGEKGDKGGAGTQPEDATGAAMGVGGGPAGDPAPARQADPGTYPNGPAGGT